jgi:hypothetical protein
MKTLLVLTLGTAAGAMAIWSWRRQRPGRSALSSPGFIYAGSASRASRAPAVSLALAAGVSALAALAILAA